MFEQQRFLNSRCTVRILRRVKVKGHSPTRPAGPEVYEFAAIPDAVPAFRRATAHFRRASARSPRAMLALAKPDLALSGRAMRHRRTELRLRARFPAPGCAR